MKISKEARRTSRQLFRVCFVNGQLDESRVRTVMAAVVEKKPRSYVAILESFARQLRSELEKRRAIVESATELDSGLRQQLQTSLNAKYGRELTLEFVIKPDLLGGVRVRVGSDVWDGSVKARLENLKAQFA